MEEAWSFEYTVQFVKKRPIKRPANFEESDFGSEGYYRVKAFDNADIHILFWYQNYIVLTSEAVAAGL